MSSNISNSLCMWLLVYLIFISVKKMTEVYKHLSENTKSCQHKQWKINTKIIKAMQNIELQCFWITMLCTKLQCFWITKHWITSRIWKCKTIWAEATITSSDWHNVFCNTDDMNYINWMDRITAFTTTENKIRFYYTK